MHINAEVLPVRMFLAMYSYNAIEIGKKENLF